MKENYYTKSQDEYSAEDMIRDYTDVLIKFWFDSEDYESYGSTDELFEQQMEMLFNFENVDALIAKIITIVNELLEEADELCKSVEAEKSDLNKEYARNLKNGIIKRKAIFDGYLKEYQEEQEILEAFKNSQVIFLHNGDISMVQSDLSDILSKGAREVTFSMFDKLICDLRDGKHYSDKKKERKLIGKDFKNTWEKKGDGVRIFFKYVDGYIVIIGAGVKKNKRLLNQVKNRLPEVDKLVYSIRRNNITAEALARRSQKDYQSLTEMGEEFIPRHL